MNKESYIKAEGKGLAISLKSFCIKRDGDRKNTYRRVDNDMKYYLSNPFINKKVVCGVCSTDQYVSRYVISSVGQLVRMLDDSECFQEKLRYL